MPMGAHIAAVDSSRRAASSPNSRRLFESLAPVIDQLTVITNLELKNAYPGTHATSNAAFLSAAKAKWTESTDYYLGTTVDQIAAKHIGKDTRLPSLELAMDLLTTVGQCDNGYACVYQNNLSWSSPRRRCRPKRIRASRSSACSATAAARPTGRRNCARTPACSIGCSDDIARLQRKLGPADRTKVDQYLDTVREVERRIQKAEAADSRFAAARSRSARRRARRVCRPRAADVRPAGARAARRRHARDHVPAGARDQHANVSGDRRCRTAPSADPHGGNPEKLAKVAKINAFHVSLFAVFPGEAEGDAGWRRLAARPFAFTSTAAAWAIRTCTIT